MKKLYFTSHLELDEFVDRAKHLIDKRGHLTMLDLEAIYYGTLSESENPGADDFGWTREMFEEGLSKYSMLDVPHAFILSDPIELRSKSENVDHPNHYQSKNLAGVEVIDVIDAFTASLTGVEAFDAGNVIKYICRFSDKNGIEDLEKAKWYLEHLINHIKNNNKKENI